MYCSSTSLSKKNFSFANINNIKFSSCIVVPFLYIVLFMKSMAILLLDTLKAKQANIVNRKLPFQSRNLNFTSLYIKNNKM